MKTLLKKIVISSLAALIVFFSFVPNLLTAKAATPDPTPTAPTGTSTWYNSSFKDWFGKVYDESNPSEIFGERYTAAQVQWVIYGFWGFLINTTTGAQNTEVIKCFLNGATKIEDCKDKIQKLASSANTSNLALFPVNNKSLWSLVFAERPISGISYVRQKVQNFSLVPAVYAQQSPGFGFGALSPIQGMWRAIRNISFGIFVLVTMAFAFLIMFRVKLSPQTVISVQSALPKIIGSLILVTFSYAIAGFLIDIMYIVIGLLSLACAQIFSISVAGLGITASTYFNLMTLGQPFGTNMQAGIFGLASLFFFMFFLPFRMLLGVITGIVSVALPPVAIIAVILYNLIYIVALVIFFLNTIKTIWALLKAFVNVLLLTVFAPLQFAVGTIIPSFGFGQWLKSYASNLSVFVVTGVLFVFSFLFIIQGILIGIGGAVKEAIKYFLGPLLGPLVSVLVPPLNPNPTPGWPPLLGTSSEVWTGLLFLAVGFVMYTLIPKATEIIQGLLTGRPFAYGTAIGEALGPITGPAGFAWGAAKKGATDAGVKIARDELAALWAQIRPGSGAPGGTAGGGGVGMPGTTTRGTTIGGGGTTTTTP